MSAARVCKQSGILKSKYKPWALCTDSWKVNAKLIVFTTPTRGFLQTSGRSSCEKLQVGCENMWNQKQPAGGRSPTDVFCGKLMSTPIRWNWNTLFTYFAQTFNMRWFAFWLWLSRSMFVITNKPKQTTLLGKHWQTHHQQVGQVVFLPWYWTRQPNYQTCPTNHHERVQTRRPYIERELYFGELFILNTPPPQEKTLKLTSDVIQGLAFAKAKVSSKLVGNSNLSSTFHTQKIVSKGFN